MLLCFQNAFTPPCPVRRDFNGNFGAAIVKQQTPAQKFFQIVSPNELLTERNFFQTILNGKPPSDCEGMTISSSAENQTLAQLAPFNHWRVQSLEPI